MLSAAYKSPNVAYAVFTCRNVTDPLEVEMKALLNLGRLHSISEHLHKRYAPDPHWYLFLLGIDPASQGQGLGGRLLEHVLARADAAHLPCYLETYDISAVRFY